MEPQLPSPVSGHGGGRLGTGHTLVAGGAAAGGVRGVGHAVVGAGVGGPVERVVRGVVRAVVGGLSR